jgi:mannitol 2-dehydrogenase
MIGYIPVEAGHQALIREMADPAIRIVSLTVTEGGYFLDPATKRFDDTHPDIIFDASHPDTPRTAFGAIVRSLKIRRDGGLDPFTCQSCDNLPGNGAILREVILGLAEMTDPALAEWIGEKVSFPNSMVDCIVPATGPDELALARKLGVQDQVPVTHESFRQWVIEDDFCAGRPPWETIGATISDRVHDYEAMKLRLLNGGHQIIAAPAEILGLTTISEAMQTPGIKQLFRKTALTEIAPHVPDVPGVTVADYVDLIDQRFSNPAIHDTVRRVAFDGSSRHTGAVLPVIRDAITAESAVEGLALSQALWARMCEGTREDGTTIEPNDPAWDALTRAAQAAKSDPQAWLGQGQIYGPIAENEKFSEAFARWLNQIYLEGVTATLHTFLSR